MKTCLGPVLCPAGAFSSITSALQNIPATGKGLIWCRPRADTWKIAGNYADGKAWNGQVQLVPATPTSLASLARNKS